MPVEKQTQVGAFLKNNYGSCYNIYNMKVIFEPGKERKEL